MLVMALRQIQQQKYTMGSLASMWETKINIYLSGVYLVWLFKEFTHSLQRRLLAIPELGSLLCGTGKKHDTNLNPNSTTNIAFNNIVLPPHPAFQVYLLSLLITKQALRWVVSGKCAAAWTSLVPTVLPPKAQSHHVSVQSICPTK